MSQAGRANTGGGGVGILTITGTSGGAVPANLLNNINLVGGGGVTVQGNIGTNTLTVYANDGGATGTGNTICVRDFRNCVVKI